MRFIILSATIFVIGSFLAGCGSNRPQTGATAGLSGEYWAKDNLDLQRVGSLLERSDSPEEFEAFLNEDDGVNNLDLNGDGYVDYISVDEFEDRGDYERGLSLYCRYEPDVIQEVAEIVFYRDDFNYPGARVLITGDDHIYGDDYYVETNWVDRSIALITFLFNPRDEYYHSPYYFDNYPADYVVYEVVETPVYRTRIVELYPQPVFAFTTAPTFINNVTISSPHEGRQMDRVYARLAKPTREQSEFIRSDPSRAQIGRVEGEAKPIDRRVDKRGQPHGAPQPERQLGEVRGAGPERGNPTKAARHERPNIESSKPARVERPRFDSPSPAKVDRPRPARTERPRSARAERPSMNTTRPARFERPRMNPSRPARIEQPRMNPSRPARVEQPRMNPSRPARVEQPRANSPKPARAEQPRMNQPGAANPGNPGGKGGGKGKKP